jgi:hypothetical protein
MAKCDAGSCQACEAVDFSRCVSCVGRFADDGQFPGLCIAKRTCSTPTHDTSFTAGCWRTATDCSRCEICDEGYARILQSGTYRCLACSSLDANCEACTYTAASVDSDTGEETPASSTCTRCKEGYGYDSSTTSCVVCTAANARACTVDGDSQTLMTCKEGYYLSSDGTSCNRFCNEGEAPTTPTWSKTTSSFTAA